MAASGLLGVGLSFGSLEALVTIRSRWWFGGLGLAAVAAFVLASWLSEEFEETRARGGVADFLHWLTMSVTGLVIAMVLGLVALFVLGSSGIRFRAGDFSWWALLADLVIGGLAGAATAILSGAVGGTLWLLVRAATRSPGPKSRDSASFGRLVLHYSAVTSVALAVSVGLQALAYNRNWSGDALSLYLPVAGWFVGSAVAWWAPSIASRVMPSRGRPSGRGIRHHRRTRHVVRGLGFALFVLIVASVFYGAVFRAADAATKQLWSGSSTSVDAAIPDCGPSGGAYALAARFCPALRFEARESWRPTSVTWFERHAKTSKACASGCYQLTCDVALPPRNCAPDGTSDPTIYVRVLRGSSERDWPSTDSQMPNALRHGWTLLQYWFFYNYDSLGALPGVWQWHQGDWEQVTVALAGNGASAKPVFLAYSEHCSGTRLPWALVVRVHGTHPLVLVARGSHANYARHVDAALRAIGCAHEFAPPPYFGAAGLFYAVASHGGDLEVPFDYAFDIRDRTGTIVQRTRFTLRLLRAHDGIEDFPGTWGLDNQVSAFGQPWFKGTAPSSPSNQGPWKAPGAGMLCSDRWFHPAEVAESRICRVIARR